MLASMNGSLLSFWAVIHKTNLFFVSVALLALFSGCQQSPDKKFENYVIGEGKKVLSRLSPETNTEDMLTEHSLNSIKYDVRKTDSLTSPFMAHVTYEVASFGEDHDDLIIDTKHTTRLDYAFQDKKWILKRATRYDYKAEFVSGNRSRFFRVRETLNQVRDVAEGEELRRQMEVFSEGDMGFLWKDF